MPSWRRSRLPVHFEDEAKPFRRFCKPRNEHSYDIFNQPTGPGFVRFKTTQQNYFGQDISAMDVGESNQGIVVRCCLAAPAPCPHPCLSPPPAPLPPDASAFASQSEKTMWIHKEQAK